MSVEDIKKDSWPLWLRIWFWIQLVVVTFDASFVLSRPYSFPNGPIGFMYPAFHIYMVVDKVYGDHLNPFGWAVSTMCLIENAILFYAMFILHPKEQKSKGKFSYMQWSDYIALLAVSMQLGKSIFYWLNDAYGGFAHVSHNAFPELMGFFIIPNAIWLVGPILVLRHFRTKINNTIEKSNKSL